MQVLDGMNVFLVLLSRMAKLLRLRFNSTAEVAPKEIMIMISLQEKHTLRFLLQHARNIKLKNHILNTCKVLNSMHKRGDWTLKKDKNM